MPLEGLKGKRALVTGAASGIGHAVREKLASHGVDFLVNVAGGSVVPTAKNTLPALPKNAVQLEDIDDALWAGVIAANLTTAFLVCREFAPRMKARKSGRIIGLTKTLALELGPFGLTVNAIAPGYIKTERIAQASWGHDSPQAERAFIQSLPLRRAGKPDDIAGVVAMLCSEAGGYVSGATIDVNGGRYSGP